MGESIGDGEIYGNDLVSRQQLITPEDRKIIGELYENHTPRERINVALAIAEMRSAATGGLICEVDEEEDFSNS